MPRNNYDALDLAILDAIDGGVRDFTSIAYSTKIVDLSSPLASRMGEAFRVVDRRLQALRKRGFIEFREKQWHMILRTPT